MKMPPRAMSAPTTGDRILSNYMGVVPAPVTHALEELSAGGEAVVKYFGWQRFEHHLLEMDEEVVRT